MLSYWKRFEKNIFIQDHYFLGKSLTWWFGLRCFKSTICTYILTRSQSGTNLRMYSWVKFQCGLHLVLYRWYFTCVIWDIFWLMSHDTIGHSADHVLLGSFNLDYITSLFMCLIWYRWYLAHWTFPNMHNIHNRP